MSKLNKNNSNYDFAQCIIRLYQITSQIRDVLTMIQRDAFDAINDQKKFNGLKEKSIKKIDKIVDTFEKDAKEIGVHKEFIILKETSKTALIALPFPDEFDVRGQNWTNKAIKVGLGVYLEKKCMRDLKKKPKVKSLKQCEECKYLCETQEVVFEGDITKELCEDCAEFYATPKAANKLRDFYKFAIDLK